MLPHKMQLKSEFTRAYSKPYINNIFFEKKKHNQEIFDDSENLARNKFITFAFAEWFGQSGFCRRFG